MADEEHQQHTEEPVQNGVAPQQDGDHQERHTDDAGGPAAEEEQLKDAASPAEEGGEHSSERAGDEPFQNGGEMAAPEEEEGSEGNVADKNVFLAESRRIDESTATIIRALSAMTNIEDEDVRANIGGVFADIVAEENSLFSPVPGYIAQILDDEKQMRQKRMRNVQPHDDVPIAAGSPAAGEYSEEHRAFVDPSKPLALPFSLTREAKENPNRNTATGAYHDIFYGDGSQCVFSPPKDNKRVQLERERASHELPRRKPVSYEPEPRQTLKVGSDFVPSCATGISASQRDSANTVIRRSSGTAPRKSKPDPKGGRKTAVEK